MNKTNDKRLEAKIARRSRRLMWKFRLQRLARQATKIMIITAILALAYTAIFRTEYDTGVCLNNEQDGMIYNADPYYNYISYRSINAQAGDKVFTVLILNPLNTYCDDYIYRHDWIYERG